MQYREWKERLLLEWWKGLEVWCKLREKDSSCCGLASPGKVSWRPGVYVGPLSHSAGVRRPEIFSLTLSTYFLGWGKWSFDTNINLISSVLPLYPFISPANAHCLSTKDVPTTVVGTESTSWGKAVWSYLLVHQFK